jgi:hypothetical protein
MEAVALQDYATALSEFRPLAQQGDEDSQTMLGMMHSKGMGVTQNCKVAIEWYTLAAKQGHPVAQYTLGNWYREGKHVPKNYKTAVKWYTLAARLDASAQNNLGAMYAHGLGVPKDYVIAHMWINLAVANENKRASGLRDHLEKKMTPSQIAEAQKLARECVRKQYEGC